MSAQPPDRGAGAAQFHVLLALEAVAALAAAGPLTATQRAAATEVRALSSAVHGLVGRSALARDDGERELVAADAAEIVERADELRAALEQSAAAAGPDGTD